MSAQPVLVPSRLIIERQQFRIANLEAEVESRAQALLAQARGAKIESDTEGRRVAALLSPREKLNIRCIMRGMDNLETAIVMNTTAQVVKNRLRAVFQKTGTRDRLNLALYVMKHPALKAALKV